jgi:hypothetical protein
LTTVQKLAAKEHSGWQWECVDVDLCICWKKYTLHRCRINHSNIESIKGEYDN